MPSPAAAWSATTTARRATSCRRPIPACCSTVPRSTRTRPDSRRSVVALGTNDFSTPLRADEPRKKRQALHAEYDQTCMAFIGSLHSRYPDAQFVLWATDLLQSEVRSEAQRVVARLQEAGETQTGLVPVDGLSMTACHWHPSLEDHARIADALVRHIDPLPWPWPREPGICRQRPGPRPSAGLNALRQPARLVPPRPPRTAPQPALRA